MSSKGQPCPMCDKFFPGNSIALHAANCVGPQGNTSTRVGTKQGTLFTWATGRDKPPPKQHNPSTDDDLFEDDGLEELDLDSVMPCDTLVTRTPVAQPRSIHQSKPAVTPTPWKPPPPAIAGTSFRTPEKRPPAPELTSPTTEDVWSQSALPRFEPSVGKTWIYPKKLFRKYQYQIAEAALLRNTLVALPTGLGKTFIAAVVMFNFYRWYPTGKVSLFPLESEV